MSTYVPTNGLTDIPSSTAGVVNSKHQGTMSRAVDLGPTPER
jgi:hypothetical protein